MKKNIEWNKDEEIKKSIEWNKEEEMKKGNSKGESSKKQST